MRVRFAPSPTGFLHIGNARTAVCNYVIAKKTGATYVLRIEDTDMERSSLESEKSILEDLRWLGIRWDEGPDAGGDLGPYRQSERFDIYRTYTEKLLAQGKAYHCYCSPEELEAGRRSATSEGRPFVYPGTCRNLSETQRRNFETQGRRPTVRFLVPDGETIAINDHVKGRVVFASENIGGDFIIVRSDGTPIYNYIVTIDDTLMKITHVIRGEDHLPNTPKQVLIARALGLPEPEYAHLALVLGPDRAKLSKRHGITSVEMYRREGYLPEALVNYLSMLGWATESGEEIIPFEEIVRQIELEHLARSAAVFDFVKLRWMNGNYIRSADPGRITDLCIPYLEEAGFDTASFPRPWLEKVIDLVRGNCEVLSDVTKFAPPFLAEVMEPDAEADAMLREDDSKKIIAEAQRLLSGELNEDNFSTELVNRIKAGTGLKGKKLFHPVRALLTGSLAGPELDLAIPLIGYKKCRARAEFIKEKYLG
ncbi:MAG: glutamate--tRNA ligase [Spirochaetes bacterium]|nr:MAG: glutamate--tRNA ligase [Spirochaetota bacterium]